MDLALLVLGLALLGAGGDALVRGAAGLARTFGISQLTIGLTVVAFGTSAPELAVNLIAAWRGSGSISFGNIMGSNMANIGLIVALTALIRPVQIQEQVVRREMPMMLGATAVAIVMAFDVALQGHEVDLYERGDGLALLVLFVLFLYTMVRDVRRQAARNHENRQQTPRSVQRRTVALQVLALVGGIAVLSVGARITVDAAVSLAQTLGVPEVIIGLTLIAVGTSLPELAASVVAALRGAMGLAVGNVIGSNIFNLLLIAGVTASVRPFEVPEGGHMDLMVMAVLSLLLLLVSRTHTRRILRLEGALLVTLYAGYIALRAIASMS